MTEKKHKNTGRNWFWRTIDSIEGDKVVWIIVLLLIMFSILAIFSSTSLLKEGTKDRIDFITDHTVVAGVGLLLVFIIYKIPWIGFFRACSKAGFGVSLFLLALLDCHVKIPGVIHAEYINGAWRTLSLFDKQLHVFEVVKVAMVVYLAWAMFAYKEDQAAAEKHRTSKYLGLANRLSRYRHLTFLGTPLGKRILYMYLPIMITSVLVMLGSNSSGIFIGAVLIAVLFIGELPKGEIIKTGALLAAIIGLLVGTYYMTGKPIRVGTMISRLTTDYTDESLLDGLTPGTEEHKKVIDKMRQPYGARIAVHEGGLIGKHSGNSTQKYAVTNIYGDYMYSFIIEEYGLIGGIIILFLYVTLLARGSLIAKNCSNEYAKITVGGLTILITGQAFMHMMVNVNIIPMTGQTLPLISHGSFAFIMFCVAFGLILSISRMAQKKIKEEEEAARPLYESDKDDIQVTMDVLEQL